MRTVCCSHPQVTSVVGSFVAARRDVAARHLGGSERSGALNAVQLPFTLSP